MITNIANTSFNSGRFPAKLKLGLITPLLKKAGLDATDDCNFKPISNLPTMSKLLERLALSRLQPHLLSSPNFSTLQSAYRSYIPLRQLCSRSLMISTDRWTMVPLLPWSASTSLLLTIPLITGVLSSRLQSDVSIDGKALAWIPSYPSDRHSFVQVGRSAACQQPCIAGVPQGSVLGPLLFTAYISPIGRVVRGFGVNHHTYADDTQLYVEMADGGSLDQLSRCISCLQHWLLRNQLLLNGSKSEAIIIGTAQRHARSLQLSEMSVAGSGVVVRESLKLLGVTFDRTMSFDKHVSSVVRACSFHMSGLRHFRSLVSDEVAHQIACSIVGSRLDYCNSLLLNCSNRNLDKLQRVQNNLARVV